jgi:prefoldin subunit 5
MASYVQEQRRLAGQMQALQQNMHGMQQKLDALKSLERNLSERGEAGTARRR